MVRTSGSSSTVTGPPTRLLLLGFYTYHAFHRPPRVVTDSYSLVQGLPDRKLGLEETGHLFKPSVPGNVM